MTESMHMNETVDNDLSQHGVELDEDHQQDKTENTSGEPYFWHDTPSSSRSSLSVESISRTGYMKRFTTQAVVVNELLKLENDKFELVKLKRSTDVNEEDMSFFNSVLPTVKSLSPKYRFIFRVKVQQMLYELDIQEPANRPS